MTDQPNTETATEKPTLMVVTLKSGAQLRALVDEYTIQRNHFGALVGLKWQPADQAPTTIQYLDADEVAAVHTEHTEGTDPR